MEDSDSWLVGLGVGRGIYGRQAVKEFVRVDDVLQGNDDEKWHYKVGGDMSIVGPSVAGSRAPQTVPKIQREL